MRHILIYRLKASFKFLSLYSWLLSILVSSRIILPVTISVPGNIMQSDFIILTFFYHDILNIMVLTVNFP